MNEPIKGRRRFFSFRSLLSAYSLTWLACLLFLQFIILPEVSHTYSHHLHDIGGNNSSVPVLTTLLAMPVIGPDPWSLGGLGAQPVRFLVVHYLVWSLLYLSALLPPVVVWTVGADDQARWSWVYASAGHATLVIVIVVLTAFGLHAPFLLL